MNPRERFHSRESSGQTQIESRHESAWVQFQVLGPQARGTALSLVSLREGSAVRR